MAINESLSSGTHLYEVEHRAYHLERPGFRVTELRLSASQTIPWHSHTHVGDTFYVLEGTMRLYLQQPKENRLLQAGESYCVAATRPHLVTNDGESSLSFLVLQGVGEYDYVPLTLKQ